MTESVDIEYDSHDWAVHRMPTSRRELNMQVSRIRLKNWRNFREVDVPLRLRTFVAGPNASGKSNLLDVFRFLRDVAKAGGGLQQAVVEDRGGLSKIRCLAARKDPVVEIEVTLGSRSTEESEWRYAIGIVQEQRGYRQPILHFERVWKDGVLLLDRPDADDGADVQRRTQTHLEQVSLNQSFRELARYFESVSYLHLVPQLLRHPDAFSGPGLAGDPFGRGFLDRLARTPERTRTRRLGWIEQQLRKVVPQFQELVFVRDEVGKSHLEVLYKHWRPNAGKQREDQFSDGTLRLIALFWSLIENDSLLLLEEPELSLNAGIVEKLGPIIYNLRTKRSRQAIISSHSPALLSDPGIEPESVLVLEPGEYGTEVRLASDIEEVAALLDAGLPVSEALLPRFRPAAASPRDLLDAPA